MTSRKTDWLIITALMVLSLVPAVAGSARLAEIASGAQVTAANARFMAAPLPVILHVVAAIVYSVLGVFQFAPAFRRRQRGWHRAAGKVLIPAGIVVALTGIWMAHFYPWPEGDGYAVYVERLFFGSAMLTSIAMGIQAVRVRDFATHGAWMMRAYAIGLGAGTQVFTHLPWFLLVDGKPGEMPRAIMMGAGWVINVAVAEWVIRHKSRQTRPVLAMAG